MMVLLLVVIVATNGCWIKTTNNMIFYFHFIIYNSARKENYATSERESRVCDEVKPNYCVTC